MSVVFLGSGPFAVPALAALARSEAPPALVVTRPDRPGGRGRKPTPMPVRTAAAALGLPVEAPASANEAAFLERLRPLAPELIIVADYGELLRRPLRSLARIGTFNLHGSLLPRHRGAAPVAAAILAGDVETGVTLFRIEKGLDSGPVVDRIATAIGPLETAGELEERLARLGADLLLCNLPRLCSGRFPEEAQDESRATLAPKLAKGAGEIDWTRPAEELARFIRALSPRPGAYSFLERARSRPGTPPERVRILRAAPVAAAGGAALPPGSVARVEKDGFRVAAGAGEIEVHELQPAARGVLKASEFLRGHPLEPRDRFRRASPA